VATKYKNGEKGENSVAKTGGDMGDLRSGIDCPEMFGPSWRRGRSTK